MSLIDNIKNEVKEKKHIQFSKKVVTMCVANLIAIEVFAMVMIYRTGDTSQLMYLITAIAAECLGSVIWYMKNSETEKKEKIRAEVERLRVEFQKNLNNPENPIEEKEVSDMDSLINSIESIVGSVEDASSKGVG